MDDSLDGTVLKYAWCLEKDGMIHSRWDTVSLRQYLWGLTLEHKISKDGDFRKLHSKGLRKTAWLLMENHAYEDWQFKSSN